LLAFSRFSQLSPSASMLQQNASILFGSRRRQTAAFFRKSPISCGVVSPLCGRVHEIGEPARKCNR